MNSKDLYNAIGKVDDDILEQSEAIKKKTGWLKWGAMAACLCLCIIGAASILHPNGGSQDPAAHDIAALEFNGCYYEVCDADWVLEKYGLPGKITAEMAGAHLAYLCHDGGSKYEEIATQSDIELYQYAPSPCKGVYVVRDGVNYKAALFCNFRLFDDNTNVELLELYRAYGVDDAKDIAAIARTKSKMGAETVVGKPIANTDAIAEFYRLTTALDSYGNDDFQSAVFGNIPEEDQPAAHGSFADDAMTIRIETKTGLRFHLRFYPSYNWIYGPGTTSYYQMNEAINSWIEIYVS